MGIEKTKEEALSALLDGEISENIEIRKCVAKHMLHCRKLSHMTQEQVGEEAGITRQAIGMYEKGKRMPSISMLIRLSDIYGVTLEDLVGYSELQIFLRMRV